MNTSRRLGLVGGLGVGATIHYYEKLAKAHEAQGRTLDIVIVHAETSRVFEHVQADDRDGLAKYLTATHLINKWRGRSRGQRPSPEENG
jgi:aspartate/glutamate racemase